MVRQRHSAGILLATMLIIKPIAFDVKNDGYFAVIESRWYCLTMPVMRCVPINPIRRACAASWAIVEPRLTLMGPNFDPAEVWDFLHASAIRQCTALDGGV